MSIEERKKWQADLRQRVRQLAADDLARGGDGNAKLLPANPDSIIHRSLWEPAVKRLAGYFDPSDAGIGDVCQRMISQKRLGAILATMGIGAALGMQETAKNAFLYLTGRQCGCANAQTRLNSRYPRREWLKPRQPLAFFNFCDNDSVWMAQGLIRSLREHGVTADFHVFSPNRVRGADYSVAFSPEPARRRGWHCKLDLLVSAPPRPSAWSNPGPASSAPESPMQRAAIMKSMLPTSRTSSASRQTGKRLSALLT
jgi:hypothetical protein